ncbi:hypothetical protein ITP53_05935 [Nonomuraea sp. K274]|uniref:Uncharacterized protein n=1 Tax=Nonomuraea cypriaca TaxID=1187855 RepID=A0A931A9I1_9ACTN|nr:hypothetical protein [Nonomuraea cypriaca]MBF8185282.1 hypothetical protein [Nonomuraea cypriaca]
MNEATARLLFDVVERLEESIVAREFPAVVAMEGTSRLVLSDPGYLRDPVAAAAFEIGAAEKAQEIGVVRWVLAVPQVWLFKPPSTIAVRPVSDDPLREGEQEAITWMSFDREDGVDYGRVAYVRRPNGEPVFEDPQIFDVGVQPAETMPGFVLLRECLAEDPPY